MEWGEKTKLIVGLGNPESRFDMTRHNIGFRLIDAYAEYAKFSDGLLRTPKDSLAPLRVKYKLVGGKTPVVLLKPQDWMNNSGYSVYRAVKSLYLKPKQILVIHDDMDFDFGIIKIKPGGGDGRHNGIKSVIKYCGRNFGRFRVGVGRPIEGTARDHVLSDFKINEQKMFCGLYSLATDIINCFALHGVERAMSLYNRRSNG